MFLFPSCVNLPTCVAESLSCQSSTRRAAFLCPVLLDSACPLCRAPLDATRLVEINCISRSADELESVELPRARNGGAFKLWTRR